MPFFDTLIKRSSTLNIKLENRLLQTSPIQHQRNTLHRLLREEGLFPGSASGVDVAGALRVGKELGPDHTVVTILCDSGHKHQSRLFNREWLASKGLGSAIGFG